MSKVLLNNRENTSTFKNLYYPRIQINKHGEIILAISKKETLTKGILIGLTLDSKSELPIGTKFDDWECAGELKDYDKPMTVTFENEYKGEMKSVLSWVNWD